MSEREIAIALAPLLEQPGRSAALFDLDGTLAPIVQRPEDAAVPADVTDLLERIAGRFALCGLVSGRRAAEARSISGVAGLAAIGNHGLERVEPGAATATPTEDGIADAVPGFLASLDLHALSRAGLRVEDKGPIRALHWRGAVDEAEAERRAEEIAAAAEGAGLRTHRGRKVIELRPDVDFDKGRGIELLLDGSDAENVLYAGDDRTDVDGFRALARLRDAGRLRSIVRVAVLAPESPPEVEAEADLAVEGPEGLVPLLALLAGKA